MKYEAGVLDLGVMRQAEPAGSAATSLKEFTAWPLGKVSLAGSATLGVR